MGKKKQYDPYAEFRAKSKEEQRELILSTAALCWDGAPISLARKIEIYLDVTEDDQKQRRADIMDNRETRVVL